METGLSNSVKGSSHLDSTGVLVTADEKWLPCRKGNQTLLTFLCPSCSASSVYLFHHPIVHLCLIVGALELKQIPQTKEIGVKNLDAAAASSNYAPKGLLAHQNLSFLNILFFQFERCLLLKTSFDQHTSKKKMRMKISEKKFKTAKIIGKNNKSNNHK